jgi:hypothetical protein
MKEKLFFVADEGDGMLNVFARADFNVDGYYNGHENEDGYHISDFDIVFESNRWEDVVRYTDKHSA